MSNFLAESRLPLLTYASHAGAKPPDCADENRKTVSLSIVTTGLDPVVHADERRVDDSE